jgi:hypothetical protein
MKTWRTSSYSGNENNCVEVAMTSAATDVRDTKNRDGGELTFSMGAFDAFLTEAKSGKTAHQH